MTHTKTQPVTPDIEPPAPDKYSRAVEYLTAHPEEIYPAWAMTGDHKAGCLFLPVAPLTRIRKMDGSDVLDTFPRRLDHKKCGCLTFVKGGCNVGWTDALTAAIRADTRIPSNPDEITVDHLPIFAGWQRRLDIVLTPRE